MLLVGVALVVVEVVSAMVVPQVVVVRAVRADRVLLGTIVQYLAGRPAAQHRQGEEHQDISLPLSLHRHHPSQETR